MTIYRSIAEKLLTFSLLEAESALEAIPEDERELVLNEIFKVLNKVKHPKPYGDAVTYKAPRVNAKLQKRGAKIYLWLNNRLVEFSRMGEALYAFEIEKILRGKDALNTKVLTGDTLSRKMNFVRAVVPEYHAPKEVKRCSFAEDVI